MEMLLIILLPFLLLLGTVLNHEAEKTWSNLLQMISVLGFILSIGILSVTFKVNVPANFFIHFLRYMALISLIVFIIAYLAMAIQKAMAKKSVSASSVGKQ